MRRVTNRREWTGRNWPSTFANTYAPICYTWKNCQLNYSVNCYNLELSLSEESSVPWKCWICPILQFFHCFNFIFNVFEHICLQRSYSCIFHGNRLTKHRRISSIWWLYTKNARFSGGKIAKIDISIRCARIFRIFQRAIRVFRTKCLHVPLEFLLEDEK